MGLREGDFFLKLLLDVFIALTVELLDQLPLVLFEFLDHLLEVLALFLTSALGLPWRRGPRPSERGSW
jgi:hypothetical protein